MRSFSATDLANRTGDVLAAAAQSPISIQKYGKPRFVVLTSEQFEALTTPKHETRRAFHVADLTDAEAAALVAKLQDSIDND